jgi:hypothetical protein
MANITTEKNVAKRGELPIAELFEIPVAASTKILAGGMVAVDTSGNAVKAVAASATPSAAGYGLKIVGRCEETADNSSGAAGDIKVKVRRGVFELETEAGTGIAVTAADVGELCYLVDDQTVSRDSNLGLRPEAGVVVGLEGGKVFVELGMRPRLHELRVLSNGDLSAAGNQFKYVKLNSSGKVVLSGAGENAVGVLQNTPNTNQVAVVKTYGLTKVRLGADLAQGDILASDASGKAKAAVTGRTNTSDAGAANDPLSGSFALGDLLENNAADEDLAMTFFCRMGAVPQTVS